MRYNYHLDVNTLFSFVHTCIVKKSSPNPFLLNLVSNYSELTELLDDQNIVAFMTYLAENLRQAVLKFKSINSNPAYWSAMVNFGVCY